MCSPVVLVSDPGNKSILKGFSRVSQIPRQLCDISLQIERDISLHLELFDVQLRLIGSHQLQNAATAACAALCLRDQGWKLSDTSIRAGLENASLLGRSHFLTAKDALTLGLPGATILLDGAHTKESAQALVNMVKMMLPDSRLILVVAMANDKDHFGFAKALLSAQCLEAVCLTEVDIAGDRFRTTSAALLKDSWKQVSREMGIDFLDCGDGDSESTDYRYAQSSNKSGSQPIFCFEGSLTASMKFVNKILSPESGNPNGIIVVTGSLHIVSAVFGFLEG